MSLLQQDVYDPKMVLLENGTLTKFSRKKIRMESFSTRGQAAHQIIAAMKENSAHGTMELIFVVKLDTGRVHATGTVTIQLVLEAIPKNTPYGIIVNQIEPKVHEELFSGNRQNFEELCVCLNQGRQHKKTLIHFIECDGKLRGRVL